MRNNILMRFFSKIRERDLPRKQTTKEQGRLQLLRTQKTICEVKIGSKSTHNHEIRVNCQHYLWGLWSILVFVFVLDLTKDTWFFYIFQQSKREERQYLTTVNKFLWLTLPMFYLLMENAQNIMQENQSNGLIFHDVNCECNAYKRIKIILSKKSVTPKIMAKNVFLRNSQILSC